VFDENACDISSLIGCGREFRSISRFFKPCCFAFTQNSIITIRDLKIVPNKNCFDTNVTITNNEGVRSFTANLVVNVSAVINKIWAYGTIRIPENKDDKNFRKEFTKMVVDVEKALKGAQNNFLVAKIAELTLKTADREIKFPLEKVSRNSYETIQTIKVVFTGHLSVT
jgi:hypothetical protein